MLELYHHDTSVCAQKVRLVLAEKGVNWTGHIVDIRAGEQFAPAYTKLNPKAVVPTLVHDGQVIVESSVIAEYLDDTFPESPLKIEDPLSVARMRLWVKAVDEGLHAAVATLSFSIVLRDQLLELPADQLERHLAAIPDLARQTRQRMAVELGLESPALLDAVKLYDKALADLETALSSNDWAVGSTYTLADVALTPYVSRLDQLQMSALWENRPRVSDWYDRVRARANYSAIADHAPAPYVARLKEKGGAAWPVLAGRLAMSEQSA